MWCGGTKPTNRTDNILCLGLTAQLGNQGKEHASTKSSSIPFLTGNPCFSEMHQVGGSITERQFLQSNWALRIAVTKHIKKEWQLGM